MRLPLYLENHCVETEIRRIYNAKVGACLRGRRITDDDAHVIERLKVLLETADFSRLRSAVKAVSGDKKDPAVLVVDPDNRSWIEIKKQRIKMDDPNG